MYGNRKYAQLVQGDDYINNDPEGIQHSYINQDFMLEHVSASDSSVILIV